MKEELDPNKKTILVVDDEKPIIDILVYNLKKEGYNTLEATDGEMGINVALEERPNLILLDVMLPKVDGLTVCNRIKQTYNVPILMISAKDEEVDKIVGLELGADDYITKPFSVRELMARVKANLRKNDDEKGGKEKKEDTKIVVGDLELDLEKVEVKVNGEELALQGKQFDVLEYLLNSKNTIITKDQIFDKIWGFDSETSTNVIEVYASGLRKELKKIGYDKYLKTIRGVGYIWNDK